MIRASRFLLVPSCLMLADVGAASRDSRRATTVLVVQVADAATNGFVADAQVRLPTIGRVARTRWDGEVQFGDLANGKYRIEVRAIGYAPGETTVALIGDTLPVFFSLERVSTALDTVRVRAAEIPLRLQEFETRRKAGIGRFFTDSVLTEHRAQGLRLFLAYRVPGLFFREGTLVAKNRERDCAMLVYLDGFSLGPTIGPSYSLAPKLPHNVFAREPIDFDKFRLEELAGIEVYSRADAPAQYRPSGDYCKVVLLWSKW
jgi:hypothetical protein